MSRVKLLNDLTKEEKSILRKKGKVRPRVNKWNPYPTPLQLFHIDENNKCWFPFYLGVKEIQCVIKTTKEYEHNEFYPTTSLLTIKTDEQQRDQKRVIYAALKQLKTQKCTFLNLSTGFGKTMLGIHLTSKVKRGKRMILVYSQEIQKQWVSNFKKYSTAVVQHVVGKKLDLKANVYVVGLKKASLCDSLFFENVSMLLIDEIDQLPTKSLIGVMKKIAPVYLIGMTATVNRDDNLHQALYSYFGPRETFISRFMIKKFQVIKYQTDYTPVIEYDSMGNVRDDILTDSIAFNSNRQLMICDLMQMYAFDKILALGKRIQEIEDIHNILKEKGENVDYKHTYKKEWDTSNRLLISGVKSCGRGIDIHDLKILVMMCSVNHVEQNEGRLRVNDGLIIDIVDNHPIFENRFKKRLAWYRKRGATIFYQNDGSEEIKLLK